MPREHELEWERAKHAVRKQYPRISKKSDRFWALVQSIFQKMIKKAAGVNPLVGQISKLIPQFGTWEPPGGSHPTTWRRQVGRGKYEYRRSRPEEQDPTETAGILFTAEAMHAFRVAHRQTSSAEHKQLANRTKDPAKRSFHEGEAARKNEVDNQRQFLIRDALEATANINSPEVAEGANLPNAHRDAAEANLRVARAEYGAGNQQEGDQWKEKAFAHIRKRHDEQHQQKTDKPLAPRSASPPS